MSAEAVDEYRFAARLSRKERTAAALEEACRAVAEELGGAADLAFCFFSMHHVDALAEQADAVSRLTGARVVLGASGESIVGGSEEIEGEPALAVWGARLGGVRCEPFRLDFRTTPDGGAFEGWPEEWPQSWPTDAALLMLGEPFSFPADALMARLNEDHRGVPVVGGMASGGWQPGQNRLLSGTELLARGAVGVRLSGGVRLRAVVSQGCRPIGRHYVVTRAEQNVIRELSGKPALAQLRALYPELSERERQLIGQGLHMGLVTNEYQETFRRGDFLVRNVIGADTESGALAIGDFARVGQTVQFHVRDAETADEDLRELLAAVPSEMGSRGALLFTCNGRGTRLFGQPHHDAQSLRTAWGELPVAGFFAQGEMGPIGGRNFLHGFTASIALLG